MLDPKRWARDARRAMSRMPSLRLGRVPDAPALPVRDPWPGDAGRGARILRNELELPGGVRPLGPAAWGAAPAVSARLRAAAHDFTWLRDLRALGTDGARAQARDLVADWIATRGRDRIAGRADVIGARVAAWLCHYDFFVASADDGFRSAVMARLVTDIRVLAAAIPADEADARSLTALKGLVAASVALPSVQAASLARTMRLLPQELARQILADGCHVERSPAAQLSALQDLVEIRGFLQAGLVQPPAALASAIERMAPALRAFRHGDGGLALFNGAGEHDPSLIELALNQAGRGARSPAGLTESGFQRLQAGGSVMIVDCGAPPPPGIDRLAHAGTLSLELSVGRDRLIVNCGPAPPSTGPWRDAARATAAHSTLVVADTNSSELTPDGLGRVPTVVDAQRQEANGAHWLEASHDGYKPVNGAVHHRRLYMAESGEDIRGEDSIEAAEPLSFTVRFHLHPGVTASMQQGGRNVFLRLPGGSTWSLRAKSADLSLEESIYLGGVEPRPSQQVVMTGGDGAKKMEWAITKVG